MKSKPLAVVLLAGWLTIAPPPRVCANHADYP